MRWGTPYIFSFSFNCLFLLTIFKKLLDGLKFFLGGLYVIETLVIFFLWCITMFISSETLQKRDTPTLFSKASSVRGTQRVRMEPPEVPQGSKASATGKARTRSSCQWSLRASTQWGVGGERGQVWSKHAPAACGPQSSQGPRQPVCPGRVQRGLSTVFSNCINYLITSHELW